MKKRLTKKQKEQEIIKRCEGLVVTTLRNYRHRNDFADILQEGRIALLIAFRKFDRKKSNSWWAYAKKTIGRRVTGIIRTYESRQKRNYGKLISLNESMHDNAEGDLIDYIQDTSECTEIAVLNKLELLQCMAILKKKREKEILRLRYNGYTLKAIGDIYGVSHARIGQILKRIKYKLIQEHIIEDK